MCFGRRVPVVGRRRVYHLLRLLPAGAFLTAFFAAGLAGFFTDFLAGLAGAILARCEASSGYFSGRIVPYMLRRTTSFVYLSAICSRSLAVRARSEEHTSERQSLMRNSYAVFCLKQTNYRHTISY